MHEVDRALGERALSEYRAAVERARRALQGPPPERAVVRGVLRQIEEKLAAVYRLAPLDHSQLKDEELVACAVALRVLGHLLVFLALDTSGRWTNVIVHQLRTIPDRMDLDDLVELYLASGGDLDGTIPHAVLFLDRYALSEELRRRLEDCPVGQALLMVLEPSGATPERNLGQFGPGDFPELQALLRALKVERLWSHHPVKDERAPRALSMVAHSG